MYEGVASWQRAEHWLTGEIARTSATLQSCQAIKPQGWASRSSSHLVEKSRGHKKIILYAVPGKEPFYGRSASFA